MTRATTAIRRIGPADHRRMAWKNGLGTTDEIAIDPPGAGLGGGAFNWRLSMATVGQSCPFSAFPGYERTIMLIEGAGMELDVPGQATHRLDRLFEPFVFSGDEPAQCRLLAGQVRDFNLMIARAHWRARTDVLAVGDVRAPLDAGGDVVILHCFGGVVDVAVDQAEEALPSGHTLVIEAGAPRSIPIGLAAPEAATIAIMTLTRR
jgi:uncharacterized protein